VARVASLRAGTPCARAAAGVALKASLWPAAGGGDSWELIPAVVQLRAARLKRL